VGEKKYENQQNLYNTHNVHTVAVLAPGISSVKQIVHDV